MKIKTNKVLLKKIRKLKKEINDLKLLSEKRYTHSCSCHEPQFIRGPADSLMPNPYYCD